MAPLLSAHLCLWNYHVRLETSYSIEALQLFSGSWKWRNYSSNNL